MKKPITDKDFLHCDGKKIKNVIEENVYLRGTNLGGWLLQEEWMASFKGVDSQWELLNVLENRFGPEKADELIQTFEDNFITASDLDRLKEAGFNCLRIPFWYRNFQCDDNGNWKRKADGTVDFKRLDWIVEQCRKRGIYIVLDMHGVPGFQSVAHHCCRVNHCELYDETAKGEKFRKIAVELWVKIAEHFAGNPTVAAYDLMNEPMCDFPVTEKVNKKYWDIYDLFYHAIREVDKEHIITVEAIWTPLDIPKTTQYGWENVVYQYHLYNPNNIAYNAFVCAEKLQKFNVPVMIGEFCVCRGNADWEYVLKLFNRNGYHWFTWTYKGFCNNTDYSEWFMFGSTGEKNIIDINTSSFDEIKSAWGEPLKTENNFIPMNKIELMGKYAKEQ